jgi:hypothetical protein
MKAILDKIFPYSISFLIGVLVCYFFTQIEYLEIDTKVSVPDFIVSVISIGIGIYLAVVIQRRQSHSQNHYNYLLSKLDLNWAYYNTFYEGISHRSSIELRELNPFVKQFQIRNNDLNRLFDPIMVSNNLDILIDELENIFLKSHTQNNVIDFSLNKPEIEKKGKKISKEFVRVYNEINSKY